MVSTTNFKLVREFMESCEREFGLGKEAAFVVAVAEHGRLWTDRSEELMDAYDYPEDDLDFCLKIFYKHCSMSKGNWKSFNENKSISLDIFYDARSAAKRLFKSIKFPFDTSRFIPPDEESRIDAVRNCFAKSFYQFPCIFSGSSDQGFLDYNKALLFQISENSVASSNLSLHFADCAVYYPMDEDSNRAVVKFVCIVPASVSHVLMFTKVNTIEIPAGPLLASFLLAKRRKRVQAECGPCVLFNSYDAIRSVITVIYGEHLLGKVKSCISNTTLKILEEEQPKERFYILLPYKSLVYIGYGLQIKSLILRDDLEAKTPSDFYERMNKNFDADIKGELDVCIVCESTLSDGKFLRLSLCGHLYCSECALHMLKSVSVFPVVCAQDDCKALLTFTDTDKIFVQAEFSSSQEFYAIFSSIVDRSLKSFLLNNNQGYTKCMEESCLLILDPKTVLQKYVTNPGKQEGVGLDETEKRMLVLGVVCEGCKKLRCGLCGYDTHRGLTCQQYFGRFYLNENPELKNWRNEDPSNHRFCPNKSCHATIEKAAGCNHMICERCKTNFCWLCDDYQRPKAIDIYNHLQDDHGGNGIVAEDFEEEILRMDLLN